MAEHRTGTDRGRGQGRGACARRLLVALALVLSLAAPAASAEIAGRARVIDGDTLQIDALRIRLHGIDAPELTQMCAEPGGGEWACGEASTARLTALIGGRPVVCLPRERDKYGRWVATCRSGARDLGATLVEEGLAWAYTRYSDAYARVETRAKTTRLGLWRSQTRPAWDWRAARRAPAPARTPPDPACAIKGNINAEGTRIYHIPGSRWYAGTRVDASRGQRWFCSEAEARAAGWRPPLGR